MDHGHNFEDQLMEIKEIKHLPFAGKKQPNKFFINRSPNLSDPLLGFRANQPKACSVDTGPSLRVARCMGPSAIDLDVHSGSHMKFCQKLAQHRLHYSKASQIEFTGKKDKVIWVEGTSVRITFQPGSAFFYDDRVIVSQFRIMQKNTHSVMETAAFAPRHCQSRSLPPMKFRRT